jgi:hypothetical protein
MADNLSNASEEAGPAVKALKELGLSAEKLRSLTPDAQFREIAQAMSTVANQGDRTRMTLDIFGKSGGALNNLLKEGAQGLNQYGKEAEELGLKMGNARQYVEAFGDSLHKIEVGWKAAKGRWAASWAVVLEDQTGVAGKTLKWLNETLLTDFKTTVGSTKVEARKAARELEQQLKQTEKSATKAADKVKKTLQDIPRPADWITPGIGAVTRSSAAGFSAVQEAARNKQDADRRHRETLAWLAKIEAATRGSVVTLAPVNI